MATGTYGNRHLWPTVALLARAQKNKRDSQLALLPLVRVYELLRATFYFNNMRGQVPRQAIQKQFLQIEKFFACRANRDNST
jgi:hypothetical protein